MSKTFTWAAAESARPWRVTLLYVVAAALRAASDVVGAFAMRVARAKAEAAMPVTVEFHAIHRDAGAPEGALYVNGELVGYIEGVRRL